MRDQLQMLDDADLDAVNGGFAPSHGSVWMACYFTAQHMINDMEEATAQALRNPL